MSTGGHVLVAGATGVVGRAAALRLAATGRRVTALSRRPAGIPGVRSLQLDLADPERCRAARAELGDVTHLVHAALYEKPDLVAGWAEQDHVDRNVAMLTNLLDLGLGADVVERLEHVVVLQGTKAYTGWFPDLPIPARERWEWRPSTNFYQPQQEEVLRRQEGAGWGVTFLRPQAVFGEAVGSNMNITAALGVYAALLRLDGEPLHYPGQADVVTQAVDADLLAQVIDWSLTAPAARGETFNVTNGEAFALRSCWPAIAAALGMPVGERRPMRTADVIAARHADWAGVAQRFGLRLPRLLDVTGRSLQYLDLYSGVGRAEPGPPILVSTVKLRQAGFAGCVDTEEMFGRQIAGLRAAGVLPPLEW